MELNNFHYIAVLLDLMYGMELEEEDLEEIGLRGWELIGNKNTRLYKFQATLDSNNSVELPCNASSVEAVTNLCTEPFIYLNGRYQPRGNFIKYEQIGNTLYFQRHYETVNILYKGIMLDEDGLPEITDKEAAAIATFIAYVNKYKEGLKTNNANTITLAANLEQKWLKQCDQARIKNLSQNDLNNILDIKNSWNRKSFGKPYKYMRNETHGYRMGL